jgi:putative sigma-54 modulation protein
MELTPGMKSHCEDKAGKLNKFYDRISEIEVVMDHSNAREMSAEIIVHAEHNDRLVAHCTGTDAYACVDSCVEKMERILTDHKKKLRNRKHPEA